jgi:SRSO17 transposase
MAMELEEFEQLHAAFQQFTRRYGPVFGGWAAQDRGAQYLQGLLLGRAERRNAENLAEQVAGATPRALQRFLTEAPWSVERVTDRLQADVAALLEGPDGVWVVDETGFVKQGRQSVGVARQYSGTLGQVGNCQVGVFLGYAGERGQALVDARLYLPASWTGPEGTQDRARCRAAGVPDAVPFQTKPALALGMLRAAREREQLRARWVTGDEVYGGNPAFRDALAGDGYWYVLEVPSSTLLRALRPDAPPPVPVGDGWTQRFDLDPVQPVGDLAAALPAERWHLLEIAEGAQGPRIYRWAQQRVREIRDGVLGAERELLLRTNPDGTELRHYLANTPAGVSLLVLGRIASARWTIETGFEQAKGEAGLDEYEVRSWAGWHHHIILALLASLFLLQVRLDWGGKPAPVDDPASGAGVARAAAAATLGPGRTGRLARADPGPERGSPERARLAPPAGAAAPA